MVITKEQQISQRRHAVLKLSSQGLTQQEIACKLVISQKTISNDLAWLRKDAIEDIKKNREHIAFEYKQALSNFYQLRREAWQHFNKTANEGVKTNLYAVIESINNNIMNLLAAGDMIELEVIEKSKGQANEIQEDINEIIIDKSQKLF